MDNREKELWERGCALSVNFLNPCLNSNLNKPVLEVVPVFLRTLKNFIPVKRVSERDQNLTTVPIIMLILNHKLCRNIIIWHQ